MGPLKEPLKDPLKEHEPHFYIRPERERESLEKVARRFMGLSSYGLGLLSRVV